jgi:hypothetical protein
MNEIREATERLCELVMGLGYTQHKSRAYQKYLDLMRRRKEEWKLAQGQLDFGGGND